MIKKNIPHISAPQVNTHTAHKTTNLLMKAAQCILVYRTAW